MTNSAKDFGVIDSFGLPVIIVQVRNSFFGSADPAAPVAACGHRCIGDNSCGIDAAPGPSLGELFFPPEIPAWVRQFQTFGIFAVGYLTRP